MIIRFHVSPVFVGGMLAGAIACGGGNSKTKETPATQADGPVEPPARLQELPPSTALETELPEHVREDILKPFTGDLDEMVRRRVIRIGVTFNRIFYFVDR